MATPSAKIERIFAILEQAAVEGVRCPTNDAIAALLQREGIVISGGTIPGFISHLAREGRIVVRLYHHMWREVIIAAGPHAGRGTLTPSRSAKPHRVMGRPDIVPVPD